MTLLSKLGIGVLGLGTSSTVGYGIYELARPKTFLEILSRSHTVLKTSKNDTTDDTKWDNLVIKHKAETQSPPGISKITGLTFTGSDNEAVKNDRNELKRKCEELLEKVYSEEVKTDYINAENWCTDKNLESGN